MCMKVKDLVEYLKANDLMESDAELIVMLDDGTYRDVTDVFDGTPLNREVILFGNININ